MNKKKQFATLYATNFCGVMNDNLLKMLVIYIASLWVDDELRALIVNATAGILVFPYLIFSPLAGKLPQFCKKLNIVRIAKLCELPIMGVAIAGFAMQNVIVALSAVLLMGFQSALYSPSKYGLIKDIGGIDGVSEGMGGMEAISFLGMLIGTVAASVLADKAGLGVHAFALVLLAVLGVAFSFVLRVKEEKESVETSARVFKFLRQTTQIVSKYKGLHAVIHMLSLFWWLSASLQTLLVLYCADELNMSNMQIGCLLALMAIGISVGCVLGGKIDHSHFLLGWVPMLGWLLGVLMVALFAVRMGVVATSIVVTFVAFVGGLFKIPLDAEIQKRVDTSELGAVLAYFNQISFVYIFLASATNILVLQFFPSRYIFLLIGLVFIVAPTIFIFCYRTVTCYFGRTMMHLHYDVHINNKELITKSDTNMLIWPQHQAVIDPMMLYAEFYNVPLRPLVDDGYFHIPVVGHVLSLFNAVAVPDLALSRSRSDVDKVRALDGIISDALSEGSNILFYPSGHITLDGSEQIGNRHLAYSTAQNLPAQTRVIAIRARGLWGSSWSRYGKRATPSIVKLLLLSLLRILTCWVLVTKKRRVDFEVVDITEQVKQWRTLTKQEFNRELEKWYNAD